MCWGSSWGISLTIQLYIFWKYCSFFKSFQVFREKTSVSFWKSYFRLCNIVSATTSSQHKPCSTKTMRLLGTFINFTQAFFKIFFNFHQCLYFFRFMKCFFILSPLNATASRRHKRILSLDRSDVSGMLDSIKPMLVQLSSPCWGSFDAFDQKFCVSAV